MLLVRSVLAYAAALTASHKLFPFANSADLRVRSYWDWYASVDEAIEGVSALSFASFLVSYLLQ